LKTPTTLDSLPAGSSGRVCALSGGAEFCQRLRELGFSEAAVVAKLSGRCALICRVGGARIALSGSAARHIEVEPLGRAG
jgi:ferrous iron transport protein A